MFGAGPQPHGLNEYTLFFLQNETKNANEDVLDS